MDLTISICSLPVDDPEKALHFYRDVLGFDVHNDVSFEGLRWITVSPPGQPGLELLLSPHVNPQASEADNKALGDLMAKGLLGWLVFGTKDCDATFEHIVASGAEVLQEPMDQPYGVRDCAFRDPAGNILRFTQKPQPQEQA